MDATRTAEEHFRRGQELLAGGDEAGAFEHFRTAHGLDADHPRYRSFYGLGLAMVERRFNQALELCQSAVKEEFGNPDLYVNLARVHLAFGFKPEGIRYLHRALMIEDDHAAAHAELARLGRRRRPPLPFLPRRHLLNRLAGRVRRRLWAWRWAQRADAPPASG